jgi:uncharacterized phage-like protein YoqJ
MIVGITGHRPERFDVDARGRARVSLECLLGALKPDSILSGGCRGVDLWAAEWCIRSETRLSFILPFAGHTRTWSPSDQDRYNRIVRDSVRVGVFDRVEFIGASNKKTGSYLARNRMIVDRCELLVAVWDGVPGGGTSYTVDYAKRTGRRIEYVKW